MENLLALIIQIGMAFSALFVVIFIITGIASYFGVMKLILFIPFFLRIFEMPWMMVFTKLIAYTLAAIFVKIGK